MTKLQSATVVTNLCWDPGFLMNQVFFAGSTHLFYYNPFHFCYYPHLILMNNSFFAGIGARLCWNQPVDMLQG